ncbi:aldo/keto reductase [Candidatus Halobonum tyrrellensis]|uniref:Aldo/keto reductase n=1 Tax=Candidatus Halobonum tyrrellensis G22 TaxID=1324957 RepID=V4HGE0_9EURY|nr:aldo/keto reductase [Candidatus Halobonum tyrrellensis]ESP89785.1 aldo/keto reductase [Candidatus Halobonum tyrrellensis G22]
METTTLGTTGESVSELCLGAMYFGSRIDRDTSYELLDRYYDAGGRFIDTANIYATWVDGHETPESEPLLGEWLEERGVREEMTIATKVGFGYGDVPRSLDPEVISREVDRSLDRLGIDTVDLLYVHVDDPETPQVDTMRALDEVVTAGNVDYLGASNVPAWRVARANRISEERDWSRFECVQPRFSYLIPERNPEFDAAAQLPMTDELVDYCTEADLTVLPFSPTLGGCYGRDDRPIPESYVRTENGLKMEVVEELAERHDVDGNAIVLAWMLDREYPTVPIVGCSTPEQLEANLAASAVTFTDAERERLDGIENYGYSNWELR